METTKIEWTDSTFNPWWGCVHVSPACDHCYAEAFAKRTGHAVWGAKAPRRFFEPSHWREPLKWNRQAESLRKRRRVFCASMADVFEDLPILKMERLRLWALIRLTPWLDWLLLTKRPQNIKRLLPTTADYNHINDEARDLSQRLDIAVVPTQRHGMVPDVLWPPPNVWLGTTAEDQKWFDYRKKHLLSVPASIHFISAEPLLGPIDMGLHEGTHGRRIDWVIVGGESGEGVARPFDAAWALDIKRQCETHGVAFFMKQLGRRPFRSYKVGEMAPSGIDVQLQNPAHFSCGYRQLKDPKGGDWSEWPSPFEDLKLRQFPEVRDAA